MLAWRIGAVTVTRLLEVEIPTPYDPERPFLAEATPEELRRMPWLYPHFVTPEGALKISVHALLVAAPGVRIIVDTCFGNDKPHALINREPLQTRFLEEMAELGWPREKVDVVVCTHLHVDHVGWNTMKDADRWVPTFPNARYLIGRDEWDFWSAQQNKGSVRVMEESVRPVLDAGLVDLVETDHKICNEIRLTPTIGHTPGHVSVLIESNGERAIITGDLMHHPCQVTRPEWSPQFDSDADQARRTRRKFVSDHADQPVLIIGTHFAAPTAGRIRRDGDAFRFQV
jgi:glyoxylase-like metal-dependent hydrolase (beta-lactamase superfamily II)